MRIRRHSLLALPALLSALVVAVPSPAAYLPPLQIATSAQQQPRWKSLSDRLIASIWGFGKNADSQSWRQNVQADREPPSHILARYGGDVVVRFSITTAEEAESLAEAADTLLLDVWEFSHDWVDIRLAKDVMPSLLGLLPHSLQQSHKPLLNERDLAQAIYNTYSTTDYEPNFFFNDYQPLHTIRPWLHLFASLFRTHCRLINIGTSYEGRDILGLRLGVHPTNDEEPEPPARQTVIVAGGSHAREWISTSTVNYVAYRLMTGYGKVPVITTLLEQFDFVFIPTLNPDGYVYTWETDRLWRKNRQPTTVRFCRGIDLDRSFGYEWSGASTEGNPCSESFAGEAPFEAFESKRLAEWAKNETENNNVQFVGFLDLHSYSQQILYPYSYSCRDTPPGQENLEELALGLEKAIRISSSYDYEVMAACEGNVDSTNGKSTVLPNIEHSGGSALDWFYHELHVPYSYQIKLRDRGTYGFLLPKENIEPTGREIMEAILYFGRFLMEGYPKQDVNEEEVGKDEGNDGMAVATNEGQHAIGELAVEDLMDEDPDWSWDLRRRRRR